MDSKKEGFPEMEKILLSLLSRAECDVFRDPVDHKGLGLFDYLDIVKQPMDLGTIRQKMESNQYENIEEMANDIRLVWTNCMTYNRDGSEYYHLAETFSRAFEEAFAALRRLQAGSDKNRVPSLDERLQLSHDIFKIDNIEMGRVLTMIEEACPRAIARKVSVDEVLLNLDALPPVTFHEVNNFVCNCLLQQGGKKKKRAAGDATGGGVTSSSKSSKKSK